mmetsp:Transcript_20830/g.20938  ORF Transcript_20830/g.20938 Transcript_20830/m.20938 type:complete len:211 (-) Transcript_20830:152-784(-)
MDHAYSPRPKNIPHLSREYEEVHSCHNSLFQKLILSVHLLVHHRSHKLHIPYKDSDHQSLSINTFHEVNQIYHKEPKHMYLRKVYPCSAADPRQDLKYESTTLLYSVETMRWYHHPLLLYLDQIDYTHRFQKSSVCQYLHPDSLLVVLQYHHRSCHTVSYQMNCLSSYNSFESFVGLNSLYRTYCNWRCRSLFYSYFHCYLCHHFALPYI